MKENIAPNPTMHVHTPLMTMGARTLIILAMHEYHRGKWQRVSILDLTIHDCDDGENVTSNDNNFVH